MADIKELEAQRDKLMQILYDEQDQINLLQEHYHEVSLARDEVNRLIAELTDGPKPTEPISIEAVRASKVVAEPIGIKEG